MEETRNRLKTVKTILIAVIAVALVAGICFMSQWEKLTYTGDLCQFCCTREPTKGKYCDICYEKVQNTFDEAFATTPDTHLS